MNNDFANYRHSRATAMDGGSTRNAGAISSESGNPVELIPSLYLGGAMDRQPCVYILTNIHNGTLYIGVTSDLPKRIWQHKNKVIEGFTKKYGVDRLVWYEAHESMDSAIRREKAIKKWNRYWKLQIIEEMNSDWRDLYNEIL